MVVGVAGVERGLEDLDLLAGDLRAAQPADQLLALAAEHAADDDFDPALVGCVPDYVHVFLLNHDGTTASKITILNVFVTS